MATVVIAIIFIGIWAFMFLLSLSAVAAFIWAIRTNQFQNFQKGAQSIFDEEEPIGEMTDGFPKHGTRGKNPNE